MFALLFLVSFLAALTAAAPIPHDKRNFNGKATYYIAGLGACGGYNTGADKIVALNQAQWDGGAHCGKSITITEGGKSAQATIVDLCPGCPHGGLDLSESLFSVFHDHGVGVFQLSWSFNDGSGGGGAQQPETTETPTPTPTPTPEPQPEPTPTPTPTPEPVTSETPSSAPESSSSPSSSSSASPSPSSSSTPISSAVPSSSLLSSVLSNSTTVSSTLSANSTLPSSSSSPLPSVSVGVDDAAVVAESPHQEGTLADLGELVATLGRLVVLGATA